MKNYFILFLILFLFNSSKAQIKNKQNVFNKDFLKPVNKVLSIELYFNYIDFYGDILANSSISFTGKFNWHLLNFLTVYSDISYGSISGEDFKRKDSFINRYYKVMMGTEGYLFNVFKPSSVSNILQVFGGMSIGIIKNNVIQSVINDNEKINLNTNLDFVYQFHGGLKFKLDKSFDINAKIIFSFIDSDELDNYKPLVKANKYNDTFNEYAIGFTYHFGGKHKESIIWRNKFY